jgi:hypothetical protein
MSNAMDGSDHNVLWNDGEEDEDISSVRKMKTMDTLHTMKIERVTLIAKGR